MRKQKLVIEVRPRLQSCQVFYKTETDKCNFNVDVQSSAITFKSEISEETFLLDNLKLKNLSLNSLKPDAENIISCRLQIYDLVRESNELNVSKKYIPNIEKGNPVQIICRSCHSYLLKEKIAFRRILPLPSAEITAGDLFCHGCCNEDFESKHNINPKPLDLLYGNYFFKLSKDLLCDLKTFAVKDIVYCQQCRTWIGSKDNVSVKMWNCTVAFDCSLDSSVTPKGDFMSVVKSIIEDSEGTMCKVVISCKYDSDRKEYLLLWIMDKHLPLIVSHDGCERLETRDVIKLLYSHETSRSTVVAQWEKDMNTHYVDVAEVMFSEGLGYLNQSNVVFPKIFRQANGMNVGYLGF